MTADHEREPALDEGVDGEPRDGDSFEERPCPSERTSGLRRILLRTLPQSTILCSVMSRT